MILAFCGFLECCGVPVAEQSADLLQSFSMMAAGAENVVELVNRLLETENVAEMCDDYASSGSGVNVTDAGVETYGPNECFAFSACKLFDWDPFVQMTSEPFSNFSLLCTRAG